MKKYIITILSVVLCFAPIYTHARNTGTCPAESCKSTPGCGFVNGVCTRCEAGTYNEGGSFSEGCIPCLKPTGSTWVSRGDYTIGMEYAKECAWEIKCPEDYQIDPNTWAKMDETSAPLSCTPCPEGYYKDASNSQTWDNFTWTSQSGLCQPKTFKIYANIILPEACGDLTDTANVFLIDDPIITYTADQTFNYPFDDIKTIIENDKWLKTDKPDFASSYSYPYMTTTFELIPFTPDMAIPKIYLKSNTSDYLVFKDETSRQNTIKYKNDAEFYINIYMTEAEPTYIAYCPSEVKTDSESNDNCVFEPFDTCVPTKKTLSDISFPKTTLDCSNGKYVNSWKLLDSANNYDWTKSTDIQFTDPITLPPSSSKIFFVAPKFQDCAPGTYNDEQTCNTTCKGCPDGFSSEIPATQCFINVPLKDKAGMFNLPNRVYYPTDN